MPALFADKYRIESARLKGWDYDRSGYYFITICTKDRICWLGKIVDGRIRLSRVDPVETGHAPSLQIWEMSLDRLNPRWPNGFTKWDIEISPGNRGFMIVLLGTNCRGRIMWLILMSVVVLAVSIATPASSAGDPGEEWGSFLDVKINAPEILRQDLKKLTRKYLNSSRSDSVIKDQVLDKDFGEILFSSVTDPYLGQEAKYRITRKCLEVLADSRQVGIPQNDEKCKTLGSSNNWFRGRGVEVW